MRVSVILPAALLVLASTGAAQQFVRDVAAITAPNVWTDGVEIVDVDADGDKDLVFANGSSYGGSGTQGSQPQHLFLNNGSGVFSPAHGQLNIANFNAKMVVAEDVDNDGDSDLLWASGSTGSPPRILINDGTGNFSDETGTRFPTFSPNPRSFSIVGGDIDNDGDIDVCVSNGGTFSGQLSQLQVLINDGTGNFTNGTATHFPADTFNCQDVTLLDFDGDFDLDVAQSGKGSSGKRGRLWLNDGNGIFTVDSAMNGLGTGQTYEIDWADHDGDGDFDAAVQSISGQNEGWGENVGPGVAMPESTFNGTNGIDDNEMANMDYDNDGDLDVFVASLGSTEKLFRNDGGGTFNSQHAQIQNVSDSSLDIQVGDLDGDCDYDLVSGNGEGGGFPNKVYDNNGVPDTIAPNFQGHTNPSGTAGSPLIFHARAADAISEDGHTNVSMTYSYTTDGGGAGSGSAFHMGTGLWRVSVPTSNGDTSVSLTWMASDGCGNSTDQAATGTLGASAWTDLGNSLDGVSGAPLLVGSGPLTAGSSNTLDLSNAAPSAIAALFVSVSSTPTPFKGGTLMTVPVLLTINLVTSPTGSVVLPFHFPSGIPAGFKFYTQYGISDAAAVKNVALSNAVEGEAQ